MRTGLAAAVLLCTATAACRRPSPSPKDAGDVVARVGDRVITVRDVEVEIELRAPGYRQQQYRRPLADRSCWTR